MYLLLVSSPSPSPSPFLLLTLLLFFSPSAERKLMTNTKKRGTQKVENRSQAENCSAASATRSDNDFKEQAATEVCPQAKVASDTLITIPLLQHSKPSVLYLWAYKSGKPGYDRRDMSALQKEKSLLFISVHAQEASNFCHALDMITCCYVNLSLTKTLTGTFFSEYVSGCSQHQFLWGGLGWGDGESF